MLSDLYLTGFACFACRQEALWGCVGGLSTKSSKHFLYNKKYAVKEKNWVHHCLPLVSFIRSECSSQCAVTHCRVQVLLLQCLVINMATGLTEICGGLPLDPLPPLRPRDPSLPHAPVRTPNLSHDEKKVNL